jgi:hypothetical protein
MRCWKEAEFSVGNGEYALGGEKCDEIVTDEKEEIGGVSVVFQCRVSVLECLFFLTERCAL